MPRNHTDDPNAHAAQNTNLPLTPIQTADDDDDGIFMRWPGMDDIAEDDFAKEAPMPDFDDEDGTDYALDPLPEAEEEDIPSDDEDEEQTHPKKKSKKEKKSKKKRKKDKHTEDDTAEEHHTYVFRRAAASDIEQSFGRSHEKKHDESDNEATLSSIKYYKHTARLKEIFLRRLLPVLLVLLFVLGFFLYFFRLQHLTFDNLRGYDAEEVFRALDIRRNQFIFTVSESDIERRLRTEFPYIQDVKVERELPDTVHLVFTEDSALFYTQLYDEFFVISESMRVLARYDSREDLDPGLRQIRLPAVSYAVVGHPLRFFDASYLLFLQSFLDVIEEADIYRGIASMDLSNRFDIILNYEDRLSIELGSDDNLETRLLFIKSTIEALEKDERGTVHIIDNKQAIFSPESRDN